MQVFFERREELAPNIWEFYFRPERAVDYAPGQYLSLVLPNVSNDPRGAGRVLTLTSLPDDPLISFVVKYVEPHSPHKDALFKLQINDPAEITDAMGDMILPKDPSLALVFIAGGIGMASFISMFKELLATRQERQIFLFYSVRSARDQIYRELTSTYPLALKTVTLSPNHITAQQIRDSTPPDTLVFISGGQQFVESLRLGLIDIGAPQENIAFDYFEGYDEL